MLYITGCFGKDKLLRLLILLEHFLGLLRYEGNGLHRWSRRRNERELKQSGLAAGSVRVIVIIMVIGVKKLLITSKIGDREP